MKNSTWDPDFLPSLITGCHDWEFEVDLKRKDLFGVGPLADVLTGIMVKANGVPGAGPCPDAR